MYYRARARGQHADVDALRTFMNDHCAGDPRPLQNAIESAVADRRAYPHWTVVAVEQPFVLDLGSTLPACIGVIDLVLRRGDEYAVVEHKTGRRTTPPDEMQLVLYREYVRRAYGCAKCRMIRDSYRLIADPSRAGTPLFKRDRIRAKTGDWDAALQTLAWARTKMTRIHETGEAPANAGIAQCRICPLIDRCKKQVVKGGSW
jgi:hypothetical protein